MISGSMIERCYVRDFHGVSYRLLIFHRRERCSTPDHRATRHQVSLQGRLEVLLEDRLRHRLPRHRVRSRTRRSFSDIFGMMALGSPKPSAVEAVTDVRPVPRFGVSLPNRSQRFVVAAILACKRTGGDQQTGLVDTERQEVSLRFVGGPPSTAVGSPRYKTDHNQYRVPSTGQSLHTDVHTSAIS